jgi:hypothetical protein
MIQDYMPTDLAPSSCSKFKWAKVRTDSSSGSVQTVSGETVTDLPDAPSSSLCRCMMETLNCISNSSNQHDYTTYHNHCDTFYVTPDPFLCKGIRLEYSSGVYGTYGSCAPLEINSWILNQLFIQKGQSADACISAGGVMQSPIPSSSRQSDCDSYLQQAGPDATGRITFTPSPIAVKSVEHPSVSTVNNKIKIGVVLGVTIFVILCISFAMAMRMRRKRVKRKTENELATFEKTELPGESLSLSPKPLTVELDSPEKHELQGSMVHEAEGESKIEIGSDTQVYELGSKDCEIVELDAKPMERKED